VLLCYKSCSDSFYGRKTDTGTHTLIEMLLDTGLGLRHLSVPILVLGHCDCGQDLVLFSVNCSLKFLDFIMSVIR